MIVMFMGRDTVDFPRLQVGTSQKKLDLYFTDFNHDLDPFAAQAVIMSDARVVLVGCQIALHSMWLFEKDLINLYKYSSTQDKNDTKHKLLNQLSRKEYYMHWLNTWKMFGKHLPPWDKYGQINGFVVSGAIFFILLMLFFCCLFVYLFICFWQFS